MPFLAVCFFTSIVRKCENIANVGFLVDSSVSSWDYEKQKTLIQRIVDIYPVSEEGSRAGVVVYNSDAEVTIPLNNKKSHDIFKKMVRAMPHTRQQPSNIVRALETTKKFLLPTMSKGLPKILIVLSGISDQTVIDSSALATILKGLHAENVSIVLVSFGMVNTDERMRSIVDSSSDLFHTVDVKELADAEFISPLAERICELGKTCEYTL